MGEALSTPEDVMIHERESVGLPFLLRSLLRLWLGLIGPSYQHVQEGEEE